MTQNRFYSSTALPTTLAAPLGSTGNPSVNGVTGLPASFPFTVLIDWGLSTQEAISVTSAPTGVGPFTLPCTRGIDGTVAQSHSQNAIVVHGVSAEDYNEPQVHIATGTSGSSYPNVIHGLANGSSVVGTTDTQTLTNKTLGSGTSFSGVDLSISNSDAANPILSVTNTHSAPSSSILRIYATTAGDTSFGIRVTGDTVNRYHADSNGKIQWGPGGSSALDTNLYRNAVGELKTDESLTVAASATIGGGQLLAGGSGVLGLVNAGTAPATTPSGGAVAYAKTGFVKWRGADGLDYNTGHTRALLNSPFTTNSSSGTAAQTATGLALTLGAFTYEIELWAPFAGAGTVGSTSTWAFTFGGTATTGTGIVGEFFTSAYTAPVYSTSITNGFTSPTLTSTDTLFKIRGIIVASGGGVLQLTIANTTAADETSVLAGAYLKALPIA
jgi:hypothetical protein